MNIDFFSWKSSNLILFVVPDSTNKVGEALIEQPVKITAHLAQRHLLEPESDVVIR